MSKHFMEMYPGDRLEIPRPTKTGKPSYVWVQGWKIVYRDGRETQSMRFGECRDMLKAERLKPIEEIDFTRVNNDTNGNPRYVCHYLHLLTQEELKEKRELLSLIHHMQPYEWALGRARHLGGKKFHNKQYGGGIVFSSYSLRELVRCIARRTGRIQITSQD